MNSRPSFVLAALSVILSALFLLLPIARAASVTLTWSFDYSVDPGCTTTVTKNCVSGFEYGTTSDGGATLNKVGTVANPSPVPTALASGITANFRQGPPYGSVTYYARTVALDASGNTIFSAPSLAQPVQLAPSAPQNLSISIR
jgi:hypothetical protein